MREERETKGARGREREEKKKKREKEERKRERESSGLVNRLGSRRGRQASSSWQWRRLLITGEAAV